MPEPSLERRRTKAGGSCIKPGKDLSPPHEGRQYAYNLRQMGSFEFVVVTTAFTSTKTLPQYS